MILFYFGNDFNKRHQKIQAVLKDVKTKRPNANFFHYDSFDVNIENLKELVISQGLFETKNIVLLTNLFLNLELKKFVLDNLEEFQNSDSAFIFSEEKITATEAKKIKEFSTKFEEFKKAEARPENLFQISDYLQKKDKKNL
jgi:DNA polymerase III delta subunit